MPRPVLFLVWFPVWILTVLLWLPVWLGLAVGLGGALFIVGVSAALRAAALLIVDATAALRTPNASRVLREELADPVGYTITLVVSAFRVELWRTVLRLLFAVIVVLVAFVIAPLAVLEIPECSAEITPPECVEHRDFDVAVAWAAAGWGILAAVPGRVWELRQSGTLRSRSYPWAWRAVAWAADLAVVVLAYATGTLSEGLVSSSSVVRGALFGAFFVALADLTIVAVSLMVTWTAATITMTRTDGTGVPPENGAQGTATALPLRGRPAPDSASGRGAMVRRDGSTPGHQGTTD